jgi:hypothetical protein
MRLTVGVAFLKRMLCNLARNAIAISTVALFGFVLSGCAATSVTSEQAIESTDRTGAEYFQQTPKNTLRIVVIHDQLFVPTPIRTTIYVDGTPLGTVNQGQKLTFFVPPGVLRLGWSALSEGNFREQYFTVSSTSNNTFHLMTPGRAGVLRYVREGAN